MFKDGTHHGGGAVRSASMGSAQAAWRSSVVASVADVQV
jgi:hypothetical protein